jgi:hypothetical protein
VNVWRYFVEFWEWLPVLAAPLIVYWLADGLTKPLSTELWLIIGFALLVNLGWIGLMRWNRRMVDFYEKYPGFRWKK